ncbi:MAG: GDSL-type esterase/lipase family protein [Phycisphaerales bacterium JB059]
MRASLYAILGLVALGSIARAGGGGRPLHDNLPATLMPLYQQLMSSCVGEVVLIGDSLTINDNTYTYALNDLMWATYGLAGDGYRGVGNGFNGGMRDGIGLVAAPNSVQSSNAGRRQLPMGAYTINGNFSTLYPPNGALLYNVYGPHVRVHYVTQPGGGRFVVVPEGGESVSVDTDADLGIGSVDVTLGGVGEIPRLLRIVTEFGSVGPVMIASIEMRSGLGGYVQHYAGRGGVGPTDFLRADEEVFESVLGTLDPELVLIMLDWVGGTEPASFRPEMNELLDRVEAGAPDAKVVLVTHHPYQPNLYQEAITYLELARERGHGFINLFDVFEDFEEMDALGYMADGVHLTEAGGQFFGSYVFDLFERQGRAAVIADASHDGQWDFTDVTAYVTLFAAQDKDADLAPPYNVWDFNDVVEFLLAYGIVAD